VFSQNLVRSFRRRDGLTIIIAILASLLLLPIYARMAVSDREVAVDAAYHLVDIGRTMRLVALSQIAPFEALKAAGIQELSEPPPKELLVALKALLRAERTYARVPSLDDWYYVSHDRGSSVRPRFDVVALLSVKESVCKEVNRAVSLVFPMPEIEAGTIASYGAIRHLPGPLGATSSGCLHNAIDDRFYFFQSLMAPRG